MGTVTVRYGWHVSQQAAAVSGSGFGTRWFQGKALTGNVTGGAHNLLTKDIIFYGKGRGALYAIVMKMKELESVKIRCGIRKGMEIESFETSEYGGGMDEVRRQATEADIVRMPYYLYAFPHDARANAFNTELFRLVTTAAAFGSSSQYVADMDILAGDVVSSALVLKDKITQFRAGADSRSDLKKAMNADEVMVLLTSKTRNGGPYLASHTHTHTMPTLAKDIYSAMQQAK
ncbi:MAG: hypothetical protein H7203_12695 [Rhizobacter sp.]|nr:hypothetical protein [Burkholderiales bacterium]